MQQHNLLVSISLIGMMVSSICCEQKASQRPRTPKGKAFVGQIQMNMQVAAVSSPPSAEEVSWQSPTKYPGYESQSVQAAIVAVAVTDPLLEAAVEYWAENRGTTSQPVSSAPSENVITPEKRNEALTKLREHFRKPGQRAFMLFVAPIVPSKHPECWGISLGRVRDNVTLVSLDEKVGKVARAESMGDEHILFTSGPKSCLLFIEDTANSQSDPTYSLLVSGITFHVKHCYSGEWIRAKQPTEACLRFETNDVRLLTMIENGMPWDEIEEKYVHTKSQIITSQLGEKAGNAFLGFAENFLVNLLVGLIVK